MARKQSSQRWTAKSTSPGTGSAVYYARVSTADQDLDVQLEDAKRVKADKVFCEKRSGLDGNRKELAKCLAYLREGDTLYCMRADRLGRSMTDLVAKIEQLNARGVQVVFTKQPELSTNTPHGKLMLGILASVAEFETALKAERQKAGIEKAKQKGVRFGRPAVIDPELATRIKQLREDLPDLSMGQIAKRLGVSRATAYRAISAGGNSA